MVKKGPKTDQSARVKEGGGGKRHFFIKRVSPITYQSLYQRLSLSQVVCIIDGTCGKWPVAEGAVTYTRYDLMIALHFIVEWQIKNKLYEPNYAYDYEKSK